MTKKITKWMRLRRYMVTGLLFWLPIWVTLLVLRFLVNMMDQTLAVIPRAYQPEQLIGFKIPGLGLIISLTVLILTGMFVKQFIGRELEKLTHIIFTRIPLVRTIYTSVKQVMETIFKSSNTAFSKVLLVEYPRKGLWSVAFQTGTGWHEVESRLASEMVNIFIPTTPNPTSGFLMLVPKSDVIELDISVDQALKFVISLGVVIPAERLSPSKTL